MHPIAPKVHSFIFRLVEETERADPSVHFHVTTHMLPPSKSAPLSALKYRKTINTVHTEDRLPILLNAALLPHAVE